MADDLTADLENLVRDYQHTKAVAADLVELPAEAGQDQMLVQGWRRRWRRRLRRLRRRISRGIRRLRGQIKRILRDPRIREAIKAKLI